jgi:hypothetical protein
MATRKPFKCLAGLVVLSLPWWGCGGAASPTAPGAAPSPGTPPAVVASARWRLSLWNTDGASFGVRIRLDGELVYEAGPAAEPSQAVEVERPYAPGSHAIEFEVVQASRRRSTYQAHVSVSVVPAGPTLFALGVPTTLAVGERLSVAVVI